MLGFFKSNKKKYEVNCPVCRKEFTIESHCVSDMLDYMDREIPRRIRSGEWKDRILKSTQPNSKAD